MPDVQEIRQRLAPVFDAYGVKRAVLFGSVAFGSFARDEETPESDVDLLVDSRLRGLRFVGLMEAVHAALLLPVDLLDVTHIEAGSPIDREIRSTGVTIYEK